MNTNYLRDASGNVLGWVQDFPFGPKLFAANGRYLGTYMESVNLTLDDHGTCVGRGNVLPMLLPRR